MPLPNGVQSRFVIKRLHQRNEAGNTGRFRRELRLFQSGSKGRRILQIQSERYVLSEVARRVGRLVLTVKLAHRRQRILREFYREHQPPDSSRDLAQYVSL